MIWYISFVIIIFIVYLEANKNTEDMLLHILRSAVKLWSDEDELFEEDSHYSSESEEEEVED